MSSWRWSVLAAEAKEAGSASERIIIIIIIQRSALAANKGRLALRTVDSLFVVTYFTWHRTLVFRELLQPTTI